MALLHTREIALRDYCFFPPTTPLYLQTADVPGIHNYKHQNQTSRVENAEKTCMKCIN